MIKVYRVVDFCTKNIVTFSLREDVTSTKRINFYLREFPL